jgi:hypothetical protein
MFQINVVEKIKTHILYSATFSQKTYSSSYNVEKYGGARETADSMDMRRSCWISKATRAKAHANARTPTREHAQKYVILFFPPTATVVS